MGTGVHGYQLDADVRPRGQFRDMDQRVVHGLRRPDEMMQHGFVQHDHHLRRVRGGQGFPLPAEPHRYLFLNGFLIHSPSRGTAHGRTRPSGASPATALEPIREACGRCLQPPASLQTSLAPAHRAGGPARPAGRTTHRPSHTPGTTMRPEHRRLGARPASFGLGDDGPVEPQLGRQGVRNAAEPGGHPGAPQFAAEECGGIGFRVASGHRGRPPGRLRQVVASARAT